MHNIMKTFLLSSLLSLFSVPFVLANLHPNGTRFAEMLIFGTHPVYWLSTLSYLGSV